jgi:hypothetical protein
VLSQTEVDTLVAMRKVFVRPAIVGFPPGLDETHELRDPSGRELFLLDLSRGTMVLAKVKMQVRGRKIIPLVRVDLFGSHTNPGPGHERIDGPHIHVYREGDGDRWAKPLDLAVFSDPTNHMGVYKDFCRYCSISGERGWQEALP